VDEEQARKDAREFLEHNPETELTIVEAVARGADDEGGSLEYLPEDG
jgi:hypothetical protein